MPGPAALPIPDDLIQLQRAVDQAEQSLAAHTVEVEQRQRQAHPGSDRDSVRARVTWPEQDADQHEQLRETVAAARLAVYEHATMREAATSGCHHQTTVVLRQAARETATQV